MSSIYPFFMFAGQAEAAMQFYASVFAPSEILDVVRYGPREAGKAGTDAEKALKSLDAFLRGLLRRGLGASELARAKTQLEFQWLNGLQFQLERARLLSSYAALIGEPSGLVRDLKSLGAVTGSELRAAARRWLAGPGRGSWGY